jgi:hypothetical protein
VGLTFCTKLFCAQLTAIDYHQNNAPINQKIETQPAIFNERGPIRWKIAPYIKKSAFLL